MKSLAMVALVAVPRPLLYWLQDQFRGWRRLFRACLVLILLYAFLFAVLAALYAVMFLGGVD